MGRETKQRVKWDKIPLYCKDCKHVGHASSACYAFGKKEVPPKKNFHDTTVRTQQGASTGTQQHYVRYDNRGMGKPHQQKEGQKGTMVHQAGESSNMGKLEGNYNGGTWQSGKRRNRKPRQGKEGTNGKAYSDGETEHLIHEEGVKHLASQYQPGHGQARGGGRGGSGRGGVRGGGGRWGGGRFAVFNKPQYYKQLENGEFDVENMEEDPKAVELEDDEMVKEPGGSSKTKEEGNASNMAKEQNHGAGSSSGGASPQ